MSDTILLGLDVGGSSIKADWWTPGAGSDLGDALRAHADTVDA